MKLNEKAIIRKSILELCDKGICRSTSIDDEIRKKSSNSGDENLWDYVVALGAQLSRPPFDPYREEIKLETKIGRKGTRKVILKTPILIYESIKLSKIEQDALNNALNRLADNRIVTGYISKDEPYEERKYPHFQIVDSAPSKIVSDGIVLRYSGKETIAEIKNIRNKFEGPILVDVDGEFVNYASQLLKASADGILVNTDKITKSEKFKGKHAIGVIREAKKAINEFYRGQEGDGACLVVLGDVNSTGKMIKAVGLGADVIGYNISILIAKAGQNSEKFFDSEITTDRIYKHLSATRDELTGIPAAIGYTNFHNLTRSDLSTYHIEASLEGDILLEGVNKTYRQVIEGVVNEYLKEKELDLSLPEKQKIVQLVIGERE